MKSFFKDYRELCKESDKWMKKTLERISGVMLYHFTDLPRSLYRRA